MKRMMTVRPIEPMEPIQLRAPRSSCVPPGAGWNGLTLPQIPSADWPASLLLDHAIDRVVRDVLGSGRSVQEAVTRITELARTILPHLTEAELDQRVHAQLIANT